MVKWPEVRRRSYCFSVMSTALIAASCTMSSIELPDAHMETDSAYSFDSSVDALRSGTSPWWEAFDDPLLRELIIDGHTHQHGGFRCRPAHRERASQCRTSRRAHQSKRRGAASLSGPPLQLMCPDS